MNWISVNERLPENNQTVFAFGKMHDQTPVLIKAAYVRHREQTMDDEDWEEYEGELEYDGAKDCLWIPEGWYERDSFITSNEKVDWCKFTHWMPLPDFPKED